MALAVVLACLWPARRSVMGLFGPMGDTSRDFRVVFLAVIPVIILGFTILWAFEPSFTPNQPFAKVWHWLLIALVFLFIQVTAEEMVFRGFVMGQLAARFASPVIWMILPAVLFGAVHYDGETYGNGAWIVCAAIAYFAVLASDITARTGNLGAAIAMHFGNNILAILVVADPRVLSGLSLYSATFDPTDMGTLITQILFVTLLWLAARFALKV